MKAESHATSDTAKYKLQKLTRWHLFHATSISNETAGGILIENEKSLVMRVLITGGRNYSDQDQLERSLDELHSRHGFTTLMHGDASGADRLAGQWAVSRGILVEAYAGDWKKLGRIAGPIRNEKMLHKKPDLVVAFPGGKGTADMISKAKKSGCDVVLIDCSGPS